MPCDRCPVPPGSPCDGTLCPLAGLPGWDRHIAGRMAALRNPPPPPPADTLPLAESLRLLALVKRCPHRDERTDCGCGGLARCHMGKGKDGLVNLADCTSCVAGPD